MREVGEKSFQEQVCGPVEIKSINLKNRGLTIISDFNVRSYKTVCSSTFLLKVKLVFSLDSGKNIR